MSELKYFDRITYGILRCARLEFGHYEDQEHMARTDKLVKAKILKANEWKAKSLRFTKTGKAYYKRFVKELQKLHGHEWLKDDDGNVEDFAHQIGEFHNGPQCRNCGYGFCQHCKNEFDVPKCTGKS